MKEKWSKEWPQNPSKQKNMTLTAGEESCAQWYRVSNKHEEPSWEVQNFVKETVWQQLGVGGAGQQQGWTWQSHKIPFCLWAVCFQQVTSPVWILRVYFWCNGCNITKCAVILKTKCEHFCVMHGDQSEVHTTSISDLQNTIFGKLRLVSSWMFTF